jgi:preprotein translocase subunit SecA
MQKLGLTNGERIESKMVSRAIEKAQKNVENHNFDIRKNLLEYDQIMNAQRIAIYGLRQAILEGKDIQQNIQDYSERSLERRIQELLPSRDKEDWNPQAIVDWSKSKYALEVKLDDIKNKAPESITEHVLAVAKEAYVRREKEFTPEIMRELERRILLDVIDDNWKDHLYNIDQLRDVIGLRGYAQIDPKLEYKREATALFDEMMDSIEDTVTRLMFLVRPVSSDRQEQEKAKLEKRWQPSEYHKDSVQTTGAGAVGEHSHEENGEEEKLKPIVSGPKVGRNDPCTCGSGKKYKKCCGKAA